MVITTTGLLSYGEHNYRLTLNSIKSQRRIKMMQELMEQTAIYGFLIILFLIGLNL